MVEFLQSIWGLCFLSHGKPSTRGDTGGGDDKQLDGLSVVAGNDEGEGDGLMSHLGNKAPIQGCDCLKGGQRLEG